ncbi:DUF1631 domain-containing protein [Pleionea sediminis]|uniref:DUF1631 domain-containing protein n=1 Tax=Pleionea sediminis TaxID=2569479 RepID=UPI0013DE3292|nr:DUF1631 domain-containing protein [Pleionea sediminis]
MNEKPQVVHFNRDSAGMFDNNKQPAPTLVLSIRDLATEELVAKLNSMLNSADDKLFDMADKSSEVVFFNSMRQVRIKRKGLVNIFKRELEFQFNKELGITERHGEHIDNVEALDFDNLSIVQEEDLEEDLAVDAMVNKGRSSNKQALSYLCARLDSLCSNKVIGEENNPLDPRVVAEAFRVSSNSLELDMQSRLVVFKLFERCVIDELEDVYTELNEELAEKGVLPDLHKRKPRRAERQKEENDKYSENSSEGDRDRMRDEVREEVFNTLRDLLGQKKVAYPEGQEVVETDQVLSALTDLQQDQGYSPQDLNTPEQVKQILGSFLPATNGQINGGTIGNVNDDVIDIVTMLFDFILDERNLHNDIKALLARLQIPMLKVGMLDRAFFSDKNHPARQLLNELSHAAIGWTPSGDPSLDPLLNKVTHIVEKITNDFKDDVHLFEELLEDFENFKQTDLKRSSILERRMKEAEEGRARSENAKQRVNGEIARMCHGRMIAEPVKCILKEAWTNVLFLESLKANNDEGWQKALKVAEFLVWSVQPKKTEDSKNKLKKIMTSLIKNLRLGMEKISFNPYRSSQLLGELEECHRKILSLPLHTDKIVQASGNTGADSEVAESMEEVVVEQVTEETLEELALPTENKEPAEDPFAYLDTDISDDDDVFEEVDGLQAGSWVEIADKESERQRCKLAAFIASVNKYIFVNRTGMKIAELNRKRLAAGIKKKFIEILDDAALFDRALESVITNLRTMKDA